MRTQLLSAITTAVSTLTQFAVASELPWEQNGNPLYRKNMKRIYVDTGRVEQTTLYPHSTEVKYFKMILSLKCI
jgi:hypothetical protein